MQLSGISPLLSSAHFHFVPASSQLHAVEHTLDYSAAEFQRSFLARVKDIKEELVDFKETLTTSLSSITAALPRAVSVSSDASLGLDLTTTAATLQSTEQVNAITTSFSPFGPAFGGASTSLPTVGGVYDGSSGDDVLTFNVKKEGNVGGPYTGKKGAPANLTIEVRDGNGDKVQDIKFDESVAPDTVFNLVNGLTVSFAAGSLVKDDTFQVAVSDSTPSQVDPNQPIDGVRNDNPNFESGFSVTAGSFEVNGIVIAVNSGDSLNDILDRITNSAAGVTATFDAGTETVRLTQKTSGSSGQIVLANDTSGLLAATKLSSATVVPGTDSDLDKPLAQVEALAAIQDGTFSVNGVSITVDTANNSLLDRLTAINQSGAGVTATFANDRVTLRANSARATLTLDDGTSGFFSALHLTPDTYQPQAASTTEASLDARALARVLNEKFNALGEQLQTLFSATESASLQHLVETTRTQVISSMLRPAQDYLGFADSTSPSLLPVDTRLGLTFTFGDASLNMIHTSEGEFYRALTHNLSKITEFLLAEPSAGTEGGLLPGLLGTFETLEVEWQTRLGLSQGLLLDQLA